jgi:Ca2+/Na+ antiporter
VTSTDASPKRAAKLRIPIWGYILGVGLVLAVVLKIARIEGPLGAVLDALAGLCLIAGSCEALITSVEGMTTLLGWNQFVGGTIAAVVSNVPEIALLGFFVLEDPTMAFVIGLMSVYTNSMAFALYAVAMPKDRGTATIPAPIVRAGTDLLSFGGGLCLALALAMIVLREFGSPIDHVGVPELYFVGFALLAVFATFLVSLVRFFSAEKGDAPRDDAPTPAAPTAAAASPTVDEAHGHGAPKTYAGVGGLLALGVFGSFLGGEAMSEVGTSIVAMFPSLSRMAVALILALIAGTPTYVIVINAHVKKQPLIALSNTFGGLTQNLFNVMAFCCLMIASFHSLGILHDQTIPITIPTTLAVALIYPTYAILSRAIEDDGKFNWIEIVSLVALFAFLMFVLIRDGG